MQRLATAANALCGQRIAVAVADLIWIGGRAGVNYFIPSGENCGPRSFIDLQTCLHYCRGNGDLGVPYACAAWQHLLSSFGLTAGSDNVFSGSTGALDFNFVALSRSVFDHHYRICAFRHGCASHDLHRCAWINRLAEIVPSLYLSNNLKSGRDRLYICCTQSIAITSSAGKGRKVTVSINGSSQDAI